MEQSYTSGGQASGMERRQACRFRPLHLLLVFVCLSPVISTVPQVEAKPSPVDLLLEDFTALLQRAQRLEQAGVPVFQRLQQHLNAFVSEVKDAQRSLWESVSRDDARGLEAAVRRGAAVEKKNANQMTPLALASKEGRADAVWALLRLGAAVNSTAGAADWTPLLWARAYRRTDCETLLLAVGAHQGKVTKEEAQDLLWKGVEEDDRLKIERAFLSGADLEERRDIWTPLTKASYNGRLDAVRALVTLRARLEGRGSWSESTALHMASWQGHEAVVRLLVEAGASLEAVDKGGWTPLHWASYSGHLPVVKLLVEAGASLMAEDEYGWTPLHYASYRGHLSTVKLLVEAGAGINHRTSDGRTPLTLAESKGHSAVSAYLRSVGATT